MVDIEALKMYGGPGAVKMDDRRLREVFTATGGKLGELREKLEDAIADKVQTHIGLGLKDYHLLSAIDLAWDGNLVNKYTIPLVMYAQGRVSVESVQQSVSEFPQLAKYIQKTPKGTQINLPKFFDTNINIVRAYVTRRVAAQTNKYNSIYPFFQYHPRLQTEVGRFRADALSERVDIIADQYNYRHIQEQAIRGMLLYQKQFAFLRSSWDREVYIKKVGLELVDKVYREGIDWVLPHPTRVFYDMAYPAASLNTDTGCEYCGYWNVVRYRDIAQSVDFFNKDAVSFNAGQWSQFSSNSMYWNQYLDRVVPPHVPADALTEGNARENFVQLYTSDMDESSVFLTEFFWKLVPSQLGLADYPYPVWCRFKVAGDRTVVYAEVMGSSPCALFEYNGNDNRRTNISFAHEILPYQDQLTNLFTQFLETVKADLFQLAVLNTDVFPETDEGQEAKEMFKAAMQGRNWTQMCHVLEASMVGKSGLVDMANVFKVHRSPANQNIQMTFNAISTLIDLSDRLFALSPQEIGQTAPRETTATEVSLVQATTESVYSHISDAVDEGRSAMKRIIYEAAQNHISDSVELSIKSSYPSSIVELAGFAPDIQEDESGDTGREKKLLIKGAFRNLIHEYTFTSRDGSERVNNPQAAQILTNLYGMLASQEDIRNAVGKQKMYDLLNMITRSLGTGFNLNLQVEPGEANEFENQTMMKELLQQVIVLVEQNADAIEQLQEMVGLGQEGESMPVESGVSPNGVSPN